MPHDFANRSFELNADLQLDAKVETERQGDYHNAIKSYQQALILDWGIGNRLKALERLEHIASLDALRGDFERCVRLSAAVHTQGKPNTDHSPDLASVRMQLGDAAFTEAWARGSAMTLDEAVEYALTTSVSPQTEHAVSTPTGV